MGFKHGTALLTSDELPSPISWGLMRPVILLNSEAAEVARRSRSDHRPRAGARRPPRLGEAAAGAGRGRLVLVQSAGLGAGPRSAPAARGSRRRRRARRRHRRHRLCRAAGRGCPPRMPRPAARRARRRAGRAIRCRAGSAECSMRASARGPVGRAFALGMFAGAVMLAAPLAALTLTAKPRGNGVRRQSQLAQTGEPQSPYYIGSAQASTPADDITEAVAEAVEAVDAVRPPLEWSEEERRELEQELAEAKEELRRAQLHGRDRHAINAASGQRGRREPQGRHNRSSGRQLDAMASTSKFAAAMRTASLSAGPHWHRRSGRLQDPWRDARVCARPGSGGLRGLTPEQLTMARRSTASTAATCGRWPRSAIRGCRSRTRSTCASTT